MRLSLREFVVKFVLIGGWFNYTSHEYGHLVMARLLGFYGEIRSTTLNAVYPTLIDPLQPLEKVLFYGAGGWAAAIAFGVIAWKNDDHENRILWKTAGIFNLIYGSIEAIAPRSFWDVGSLLALFLAFMFLMYVLMRKKPEIWV